MGSRIFADDDKDVSLLGIQYFILCMGRRLTVKPYSPSVRKELIRLHDEVHGWERFGEHNDNTFLKPLWREPG